LFISHTIACLDRIGVAAQPLHCHTGVAAQPQAVTTSLFGPKLVLRRVQSGRQMVSMQRPLLTATLSLTPAFSS